MDKSEKLNVLYEDNHVIVVEKKSGILSQADKSGDVDMLTLVKSYIKEKYDKKGEVFLGLVHRLDTLTSGIMVFARTSKAASRLSDDIRQGKMNKKYLAVFEEVIEKKKGSFEDYLAKDSIKNISYVTKDKKNGKYSKLEYEVLEIKDGMSLVKINLITGRSHQIRVQFASRGYHIVGDAKYKAKSKDKDKIALHACELGFYHPTKKELMTFELMSTRPPFDKFDYIKL
ncbi:RNA pseudouridine synthase [Peptostreptococcaceae bacterium AS15]|nr:pseudouridine synthase, RluA family [[Eubacterium] yurii subsp. margaretiae ATCC 43715]EJP18511.1 RNA pseudouridine synthase [Peptostreptococcaceae bacterium AS15]